MTAVTPIPYSVGDADSRPWGRWVVLDVAPCLVVKKLIVEPGKRTSLQRHKGRSERWISMEGIACVQQENERFFLHPGEGVLIPQDCMHRLSNEGSQSISVLEIQYGEQLCEEDIERFEDDYGRTGK